MSRPDIDPDAAHPPRPVRLADEPHHDGSALHVDAAERSLGSTVRVRLLVPDACGTTRVRLRSTPDAEPAVVEATIERREPGAAWWSADLVLHNPMNNYRWLLDGGTLGRCWLNGAGVFHRDVTDDADFRLATSPLRFPAPGSAGTATAVGHSPSWLADAVGYQIFIDRFANSGTAHPRPHWAIPRGWDDPVENTPGIRARHWYGGDLAGIEANLDHLERLGVTLIYLTPFFPAGSMHRYDASSFEHVDPALGGDDALVSMVSAAHDRGIRVIGDLTLNHTGVDHDWFRTAAADPAAEERSYYFFDDAEPDGYVAWHGVPTLPKLDHRSAALRARFYDGDTSVLARYLRAPFDLDGWRIDCANTTGRFRDHDDNHDVARAARRTMATVGNEPWLVAEHCYDSSADLDGSGWHGVMAYQWFTRPLWAWLKDPGDVSLMSAVDLIDLDGHGLVTSMRELAANVTWEARQSSMTMLDSHDTARLRSVVGGDRRRHLVALAALFTLPGVPTLFAGSEVGCEGDTMDTTRVPFPWDRLGVLDEHTPIGDRDRDRDRDDDGAEVDDGAAGADLADRRFLADVGALIALRRNSVPLRHGSLRWLDATAESVTYARETDAEVTVVHLVRAPMTTRALAAAQLGVRLDHPCEGDPAGDSEDARPPLLQFGTPVELVMPDRIVLPGTPGATIVSFPRPRIPVASGRHHAGPHGATTPWATPMAATKHPDSVE